MDKSSEVLRELAELRDAVRGLTGRIYQLELKTGGAAPNPPDVTREAEVEIPSSPSPQALWEPLNAPLPSVVEAEAPASPLLPNAPAAPIFAPRSEQPDLESRIGSQWLNRIGIAAVLIGVSYFLKYAFDNNWIGPAGRVAIGLLAGIAVVVWSEWFRGRGHKIFSYSLKAVGIGTLYLSLWAAYQLYGLVPSGVAFFAMLVVTAATAVMAWSQDAEILAAFALTGGFSTPLLLSTGQNRELELFAYVAVLDIAALFLVIFRPWRRLLLMSYTGTLLLYIAWYSQYYHRVEFALTAVFATLFFVIFAISPVIARHPQGRAQIPSVLPMMLGFVNAAVFFLQMYIMLDEIDKTRSAWVALVLAAFYIYISRMQRERYADPGETQPLRLLHLALAVGFITIAIPIYLDAHWITMGWFVEAAVLLWVAERMKSELLTVFSVGALVLGVVRLLAIDNFETGQVIFNQRMATYAVAIIVLALLIWFSRRRGDEVGEQVALVSSVALNALALWALSLEVRDFYDGQMIRASKVLGYDWRASHEIGIARDFTYSALWMAYGGMLMVIGLWKRSAFVRWQALLLIAATILKVFIYDVSSLDKGYRVVSFLVLGVLLLGISFVYQRDWLKLSKAAAQNPTKSS
jgi:uncharacterized membrane protein